MADDTSYSLETLRRAPGLFVKGIAPGAIANFLAPPPDVATNTSSLPGIVTGNVSGLGTLLDLASTPFDATTNYVRNKLGLSPAPVPQKPQFLTDFSKAYEGSVDRATAIMPQTLQPDPQNAVEEAVARGGNAVGSMLGAPIPSRAIAALPRVLQPVASFVAPLATGGGVASKAVPLGIGAVAPLAVTGAADALQTRPDSQTSRKSDSFWVTEPSTAQTATPQSTTTNAPSPQTNDTWLFQPPKQQQGGDNWLFQQPQQQPSSTDDSITPAEGAGGESGITGGGIATGIGAFVLAGLAAKYHTRIPGLASAIDRPGYLRNAQAFNDAARLRAAGDPAQTFQMKDQPAAPLAMGPVESAGRKFQTSTQDRNATVAAHMDEVQQTNKDLSHTIGIINNDASQNMRVNNFFETGVHDATGISLPAWSKLSRDIGRLSPDDQQILHSGLWSRSALDNRLDLFNKATQAGNVGADPRSFRTGLYNISDADLRANVAAMENTPHINEIADRYRAHMSGNLDILEAMGFPKADLDDIRRINPNYVPSATSTGENPHTFALRETEPYIGNEIPSTTPWDSASQHNAKLFKLAEDNAVKRSIVDASIDAQIKNPKLAQMFTRKADYAGADVGAPHDTTAWDIYRPTGKETYTTGNRAFADSFERNSTVTSASIGFMRRWYNKGVTQPLAMIGGKVFPFINAARTGYYLPINAPTGFASGYLDKLFQQATGRNLRLLADQPFGMIGAGAMDAGNRMMHGFANSLEPGARNYGNQLLRHLSGDANVDRWRDAMMQRYMASVTHEMRARGAVGGLGYGHTEVPAYQASVKGAITRNPAADMAPGLYRAKNPFTQATMPYGVGMKKVVNEAFDIVNNMGHSYFYRLNRNNPNISPERLVNETRRLTGDMGVAGRGSFTRGLNEAIPFANAATQDIAQLGRTFADRPVATPFSHIANMGLLAAGSLYTAMHTSGGLHHLFDLMSTSQRATGPTYYTDPNGDATKYQQLSLPQNVRALYPIVLDLMGYATHAWDARHDEDAFHRAYHTLSDLMSHHISSYAMTSAGHGLGQAVDPYTSVLSGGPIGNLILTLAGKQADVRPDELVSDLLHGRMPSVARDIGTRSTIPNRVGSGEPLDSNSRASHLLSSVLGIAGNVWETANRGISSAQHGGDAIHAVLDNLGQHFKDLNPMFNNRLWSNQQRISSSTPLVEATERRMRVLEETAPANTDIRYEGYTRRGGPALSGSGETKVSHDPLMQQMYWESKNYNSLVTRQKKEIGDLRKLSADLANTRDSETIRRQKSNEYAQQINDKYYTIAQTISRLNARLTQLAGRPIDIGDRSIDWSKDATQFHN